MKKYFALVILIGLIIWGFYGVQANKTPSNTASSNTQPTQQSKIGLDVGNTAPDFELTNAEGEALKLSNYRGKKVILNFWASWCPPCRQEMPDMAKFYIENKDRGIVILAVNLTNAEKSQADVTSFIEANQITFPVVLDKEGKVSQQYNVASIPASFILDTQGVIQRKLVGPMTYDSMKSMLGAVK